MFVDATAQVDVAVVTAQVDATVQVDAPDATVQYIYYFLLTEIGSLLFPPRFRIEN